VVLLLFVLGLDQFILGLNLLLDIVDFGLDLLLILQVILDLLRLGQSLGGRLGGYEFFLLFVRLVEHLIKRLMKLVHHSLVFIPVFVHVILSPLAHLINLILLSIFPVGPFFLLPLNCDVNLLGIDLSLDFLELFWILLV